MKFISIQEAINKKTGKVAVRGWIFRERGSNKFKFIILRDSTNIIQIILKKEKFEKQWKKIDALRNESSIEIEGTIKADKRAPTNFEIQASKINIIGKSNNFPLHKDQTREFLEDNRHLALRTRKLTSILKIRSTILGALHEAVRKKGFIETEAPSFNSATSEGGSETFEVKYFDKKAYLTQSWQFYAENLIQAFEKVYSLAPSFRAEKSRTPRHLTEFWHFEIEAAWLKLEDILKIAEDCIKESFAKVKKENKTEIKNLNLNLNLKTPFPKITYKKAIELLNKKGHKIKYGQDFTSTHEISIAKHYNNLVIVTNYPLEILKFYHGEDPKNPGTGKNFNILAPGIGELIDGSEREQDLKKIKQRLKKAKIDLGKSNWYLDSRRYGAVPHAGFGLGVERLIQYICKLDSIKDTIPFPRTPTRIYP